VPPSSRTRASNKIRLQSAYASPILDVQLGGQRDQSNWTLVDLQTALQGDRQTIADRLREGAPFARGALVKQNIVRRTDLVEKRVLTEA
jgi:hypothetical protein